MYLLRLFICILLVGMKLMYNINIKEELKVFFYLGL